MTYEERMVHLKKLYDSYSDQLNDTQNYDKAYELKHEIKNFLSENNLTQQDYENWKRKPNPKRGKAAAMEQLDLFMKRGDNV